MSKSRLAPQRTMTLPRLELMGCVIAARLLRFILDEINIKVNVVRAFSDSQVALCWIKGDGKVFKQFVQNRVVEIRTLIPPNSWFHVAGKINPADFTTKPFPCNKWLNSDLW